MSGDAGSSQATNSNVATGDSAGGTADTSKHIGHDTNEWKTVTIEPDYCNVGGTVPFDSYATLDNGVICSPDVIARGTEVYRQGDLYQGTQANAGAGIHSGVSQEAAQVRFLEGNSGVVVNNLPVIEQGRHALINTTPYGYSGAYSQTVTCSVPVSPEKGMQNLIDYLRDENQRMETKRIPELQGQLRDLKYQYSQTGFWPWQDWDLKGQLNEQITDTQQRIVNNQDEILRNSREIYRLNDILHPKVAGQQYLEATPSDNEQAAINRENERYQRWIENLDNWRTGPIMAGPAMIANANGAPIEVVQQLRAAGENLGFASMGMGRNSRPVNGRPLYMPIYRSGTPPTGTYIKPITMNFIPQGLNSQQFRAVTELAHGRAAELGLSNFPIVVQGSRASYTAKPTSDIDLAIKVPQRVFDNFLLNGSGLSGTINPGSSKERSFLHAVEQGIIHRGEARLRPVAREIQKEIGIDVDFSIIRQGGAFDNGYQIIVPKP